MQNFLRKNLYKILPIFCVLFIILNLKIVDNKSIIYNENYATKVSYNLLSSEPSQKNNNELYKLSEPVVKLSYMYSFGGGFFATIASGTGFSIKYDSKQKVSYVMTNAHVCAVINDFPGGAFIYSKTDEKLGSEIKNNQILFVVKLDAKKDLCLMVTQNKIPTVEFPTENYSIKQMDKIIVIGAPLGIFPMVADGYFTGYVVRQTLFDDDSGNDIMLLTTIIDHGSSGSPIFNEKGKLAGVVFAGATNTVGGTGISSFGIDMKDVREFLSETSLNIK